MSATKAWLIGIALGLAWAVGAALVMREAWEPIKGALIGTLPAVLIVMALPDVLQRHGRKTRVPGDSGRDGEE